MMIKKQQFEKIINYSKTKLKDIILDTYNLPEYKLAPYRISYYTYLYTIKYCKSLISSNQIIYKNKFLSHFKNKRDDDKYCSVALYKVINATNEYL